MSAKQTHNSKQKDEERHSDICSFELHPLLFVCRVEFAVDKGAFT